MKTAKSMINTISNQIDSGLVGKFGKMVKSQIEENKNSYVQNAINGVFLGGNKILLLKINY
ncbi:TPA: hypothetical protein ACGAWK_000650 [Streptococcus agalactiae]